MDPRKKAGFCAKPQFKQIFPPGMNTKNLKTTQCYQGDGYYDQSRYGGVTFKNKKQSKNPKLNETAKDNDPTSNMLKHDEIQTICETNSLSRGQVYQIRSNFTSMVSLSQNWLKAQEDLQTDTKANAAAQHDKPEQGINIEYFIKNCPFLMGCLPSINRRILVAAGLDASNPRLLVTWHTFLELYCTFEGGKIDLQQQTIFWKKFFDQNMSGKVLEDDYLQVLEELIRGTTLGEPNRSTIKFAKLYQNEMRKAGCLDDQYALDMNSFGQAFLSGKLDINFLSNALGKQDLTADFANMKSEKLEGMEQKMLIMRAKQREAEFLLKQNQMKEEALIMDSIESVEKNKSVEKQVQFAGEVIEENDEIV